MFSEFGLCRVSGCEARESIERVLMVCVFPLLRHVVMPSSLHQLPFRMSHLQHRFKLAASEGTIPGVSRASW